MKRFLGWIAWGVIFNVLAAVTGLPVTWPLILFALAMCAVDNLIDFGVKDT